VSVDGRFPLEGEEKPEGFPGAEVWISDLVAVRAGWMNQIGPTWGAGLKLKRFRFDYAILVDPELANQHRLAFSILL
jgi:hypothetical protein